MIDGADDTVTAPSGLPPSCVICGLSVFAADNTVLVTGPPSGIAHEECTETEITNQ